MILIGSPWVVLTIKGQHHLVQMPFVAALGQAPAQGTGIRLPKLQGPLPDALVRNETPPVGRKFFDSSKTQ